MMQFKKRRKQQKNRTLKNLALEMIHVNKWFGDSHVLRDINLEVYAQECVVIIGPSGSGKSTLLRCINGLDQFQEGSIIVEGIKLTHSMKNIEKVRREVGMVFQDFYLFPHMTILENCTLAPIHVLKMHKKEAEEQALFYLEKVRIFDQAYKYPKQLSGGQKQRAAIARSLCMQPKMMLFDEPTSALDPEMIQEVLETMLDLARSGMTMICVTHEMRFARKVADQIIFMDEGQILEKNSPEQFFTEAQHERSRIFLQKIM